MVLGFQASGHLPPGFGLGPGFDGDGGPLGSTHRIGGPTGGESPFTITPVPDPETVRGWLTHFAHDATLGMGVGDRSLIDLAEKQRAIHAHAKVRIWSLDRHLQGYDDAG